MARTFLILIDIAKLPSINRLWKMYTLDKLWELIQGSCSWVEVTEIPIQNGLYKWKRVGLCKGKFAVKGLTCIIRARLFWGPSSALWSAVCLPKCQRGHSSRSQEGCQQWLGHMVLGPHQRNRTSRKHSGQAVTVMGSQAHPWTTRCHHSNVTQGLI